METPQLPSNEEVYKVALGELLNSGIFPIDATKPDENYSYAPTKIKRICGCCGSAFVGWIFYNNHALGNSALSTWDERGCVLVGEVEDLSSMPALTEGRLFITLPHKTNKILLLTWDDL